MAFEHKTQSISLSLLSEASEAVIVEVDGNTLWFEIVENTGNFTLVIKGGGDKDNFDTTIFTATDVAELRNQTIECSYPYAEITITDTSVAGNDIEGVVRPFDYPRQTKFGDINAGNYSEFEDDGTLVFNGDATVYNDIQFSLSTARLPAANFPTWAAFTGNLKKYTFDIDDTVDLEASEVSHSYKEGSNVCLHIHIYTNGLDLTDRTVKYQIEYCIVNLDGVASATTVSKQFTIPASTADLTHLFLDLAEITGTDIDIGADITMKFTRIATDSGTDPTNDPFVSMVGIHIEEDTVGSRGEITK